MIALTYAIIAIVFVVLAIGGAVYFDQSFSKAVGDRPFVLKGRRIETDDPYVRRQFNKFFAMRVAYYLGLVVLLIVVASHVG